MKRTPRFAIYFFIGFLVYMIMDDDETLVSSGDKSWLLPILAIALVLLLGSLYLSNRKK